MKTWIAGLVLTVPVLFFGPTSVFAEYVINLQGAAVFTEKNDIRIPGDSGTKFSLTSLSRSSKSQNRRRNDTACRPIRHVPLVHQGRRFADKYT